MLKWLGGRSQPEKYITKEEVKLFNLAKVILDGGWVFDETTID